MIKYADIFALGKIAPSLMRGVWVLVDGQYGSTGKGLASSVLAEVFGSSRRPAVVVSNAGPNSGHTSYGPDGEKVVLMQLPTFAVMSQKFHNVSPDVYMTAGAILDADTLVSEIERYLPAHQVRVHPHAALVTDDAKSADKLLVDRIGSTGKGTGAAVAAKVMRARNAVASSDERLSGISGIKDISGLVERGEDVFVEVSQGFSLSLNASGMYPYVTSRDCTVAQALSDAGLHPDHYTGSIMVVRTFPIRVAGNSGPCYPDQKEISWGELGVEPEITTVTKKVRRVFTWSDEQFVRALRANRPDVLFINFVQYLPRTEREPFVLRVVDMYKRTLMRRPMAVLLGYGPTNLEVKVALDV